MKPLFLIAACILYLVRPDISFGGESVPNINQINEIDLFSDKGWMLRLHLDGSARLIFGSSATDVANAPSGTFSFQETYKLLAGHLVNNGTADNSITVSLRRPGETFPTTLYLKDGPTIKQIMSKAREKAIPLDQKRFMDLLSKHPLPGDENGATP
jgi:hypothetical protein